MKFDLASLLEFAKRYTAAWCNHDAAGVASFFEPHGSLQINDGAINEGRSAIAEAAQSFMTAFPDLIIQIDDVRIVGSQVEYHWTLVGTTTGPGGSGRRVEIRGYESWTMAGEGLIAQSQGHFDNAEYQRQLDGR